MKRRGFDWRRMPEYRLLSIAALIFLYAPLVVLVVLAFNSNRVALIWGGFSTQWFVKAFGNEDLRRAAMNSIIVAAVATPVSTLFSIPAALAFERGTFFPGRSTGEALVAMPLIAPEIVTAIATLIFFEAIGLHAGLGNVIVAHVVFCIPFAMLPIRARLRDMPRVIEDAARDLYADKWQVFYRVTLPLLAPAIVAGATLAFVVSLDDFLITLMVAQAGSTTLPVYLYGMLRLGVTPEANAAATILLVVSVAAVVLSTMLARARAVKA
ncbi:ABC transporter permease [Lichenihabitans sp. PAMC28606]|uniref:ABC transporter permease n=1 Tax=Lichenihabitans sp. PAMC28606 TaxID=2880932 RepID=UPI001D0B0313|nr:ABC transporter permease [Lichenihabitans sp. PAMC28606]UDL93195.1 ABC transporter permease [Lichenihabitans sp. PAMC28606]